MESATEESSTTIEKETHCGDCKFSKDNKRIESLKELFKYINSNTDISYQEIKELYFKATYSYNIYKVFQQKYKKSRVIEEPIATLKEIQRILIKLFEKCSLSSYCTSIKGSSAVLNAARHAGAKHLLKMDIKSCYPSITKELLINSLKNYPEVIINAVDFCLIDLDGRKVLPTGAPTSPILCNIALSPIDLKIVEILKDKYKDKYRYSRYIDDIIISTTSDKRDWEIKDIVKEVLRENKLRVNKRKSKWVNCNNDKLIITGIQINKYKNTIPRYFWKNVRSRLDHLARDGNEIDAETAGCLSYIKSVDIDRYQSLLLFFSKRKEYIEKYRNY